MTPLRLVLASLVAASSACAPTEELLSLRHTALWTDGWVDSVSKRKTERAWTHTDAGALFDGKGSVRVGSVPLVAGDFGATVRFSPGANETDFYTVLQLVDSSSGGLLNVGVDPDRGALVVQSAEFDAATHSPVVTTSYRVLGPERPVTVTIQTVGANLFIAVDGRVVETELDFPTVSGARHARVFVGGGIANTNPASATVSDVVVHSGVATEFSTTYPFATGRDGKCLEVPMMPAVSDADAAAHSWSAPEFVDVGSSESLIGVNVTNKVVGPTVTEPLRVEAPFSMSVSYGEDAEFGQGFLWMYNGNIAMFDPGLNTVSVDLGTERLTFGARAPLSNRTVTLASNGTDAWFAVDERVLTHVVLREASSGFEVFRGGPLVGASVAGATDGATRVVFW